MMRESQGIKQVTDESESQIEGGGRGRGRGRSITRKQQAMPEMQIGANVSQEN